MKEYFLTLCCVGRFLALLGDNVDGEFVGVEAAAGGQDEDEWAGCGSVGAYREGNNLFWDRIFYGERGCV